MDCLECLTLQLLRKNTSENVVCWSRLLDVNAYVNDYFRHTDKQCGLRSDCSLRSSLIWVHTACNREVFNGLADDKEDDI